MKVAKAHADTEDMDAVVSGLVGLGDGAPVTDIGDAVGDDDGKVLHPLPVSPLGSEDVLARDAQGLGCKGVSVPVR